MAKFLKGDAVLVISTGTELEVLHQSGDNVLTKRPGGGQWTYYTDELAHAPSVFCIA